MRKTESGVTIISLLPALTLGELRSRLSRISDSAMVEVYKTDLLVGETPRVDENYDEFFQRIAGNDVLEGGKV